MRTKLAIVTNMLPPYRVPLFNYIAAQPDIALRVFLCAETESNRHWEWPEDIHFDYEIGSTLTWKVTSAKTIYFNPGLTRSLQKFSPDVVVVGGMGLIGLAAWAGAKLSGADLVLWSEGTIFTEKHRSKWLLLIRRFLVHHAHAYVGVSSAAADYFRSLGADNKLIRVSLQTLDVQSFGQIVQKYRKERESLKRTWGLAGPVVAYFGNLEPYKGPDLLLDAYIKLLSYYPETELLLVGTGKMKDKLKEQAARKENAHVHFIDFKQHCEIGAYYAVSDLFCLFSRLEPFGVVITEALAAGLPVMCSRFAGAAFDLVENGQNGYIIDPNDIQTNARLMSHIVSDDSLRARMSERSKAIAQKCTVEKAATAMLDAVKCALGK